MSVTTGTGSAIGVLGFRAPRRVAIVPGVTFFLWGNANDRRSLAIFPRMSATMGLIRLVGCSRIPWITPIGHWDIIRQRSDCIVEHIILFVILPLRGAI